jgi:hypothetical protein
VYDRLTASFDLLLRVLTVGLLHLKAKVHSLSNSIPLRVFPSLLAAQLSWACSPWFVSPSTLSAELALYEQGRQHPAPFRSQVFSTSQRFQHAQHLWPCFVPLPFLGFLLQSFPLTKIARPSQGRWLPCRYS